MKLRVVFSTPGTHRLIDRAESDIRQRIASRTSTPRPDASSSARKLDTTSPEPPPFRRSIRTDDRS
jgi:hypothetical protein